MGILYAIVAWSIFGLICGALGRLLVPGRQAMSLVMTMLLGIAGSFVGGFLSYLIFGGQALQAAGILMSIVGSVVAVAIYAAVMKRKAS